MFRSCFRKFALLLSIALLGFALLGVPDDAFARAGGGGRYSGGRGGGGGGGGGGDGALFYLLFHLIIRYPYVGVPVAVVVIYVMYKGQQKGADAYRGRVIRRGAPVLDQQRKSEAVGSLREHDPSFSEQEFVKRVDSAFRKIQEAWCGHKLEGVRPFISDAIYERFALQIKEQQDLGYRDQMENLNVGHIAIAQVTSDEKFDVMTVRVNASASDYRVSLKDGKKISGSKAAEPFSEFWSFLRRRGVETKSDQPGLMEGNCPNCAGPIEMNQSAKCDHCGAHLRSGEHDWVLAEITQACEWRGTPPGRIPGVDAYREQDPSFNLQHLEDRASVLYWRKAMSDRTADVKPLRKVADPSFCDETEDYYKKIKRPNPKGKVQRRYFGDCAVGSVDTLGIIPGDEVDRALVEVRWSGNQFETDDQSPPKRKEESSVFRSLLVMTRNAGVQSDLQNCVDSAHCPACGAPEAGGASNACEYCGAVLNDGTKDWVLVGMFARFEPRAIELMDELRAYAAANVPEPERAEVIPAPAVVPQAGAGDAGGAEILAWMIKVSLADGNIDNKEKEMLNQVASHRGVPAQKLEMMVRAAQAGSMEVPEPADKEEGRAWLGAMARMALADGSLDKSEITVLQTTGATLGLSAYDIKLLVQKEKSGLYQQAKTALRKQKARRKGFD